MSPKREIVFLNENYDLREFDIFINGKKINEEKDIYKRKHSFKTDVEDEKLKVLIRQKHPCESIGSMFLESMGFILLDFFYDSSCKCDCRAVFEGEVECNCCLVNVELLKEREDRLNEKYIFRVFSNDGEIIEIRNEFESPNYLKRRWKVFKWFTLLFPIIIPIALLLGLIIIAI